MSDRLLISIDDLADFMNKYCNEYDNELNREFCIKCLSDNDCSCPGGNECMYDDDKKVYVWAINNKLNDFIIFDNKKNVFQKMLLQCLIRFLPGRKK